MSARSKLLWIEDEPDVVADFQSGLDAAGVPIEIELAEDSEEAEECLAELSHYCGAVFDCNLAKQHDSGAS